MLEPEIAAFVARADAIYPDNTPSLTTVEQRAIYERFAAAFTPARPAGEPCGSIRRSAQPSQRAYLG